MKKQLILLLVCVVLVGGLAAAFFLLKDYTPEEEASNPSSSAQPIIDKEPAQLKELSIHNETGDITVTATGAEDPAWQVQGDYTGVTFSDSQISSLVGAIVSITPTSTVQATENLADFGLQSPRATATATFQDGSTFTLKVGSDAPGGSEIYCQTGDSDSIYVIPSTKAEKFLQGAEALVDLAITDAAVDADGQATLIAPSRLTFAGSVRTEPIVLVDTTNSEANHVKDYGFTTFAIVEPTENEAAYDVSDVVMQLFGLSAQEVTDIVMPTDSTYPQVDYSTVEFTYTDPKDSQTKTVKLMASQPEEDGTCLLMKEGCPVVYRVSAEKLPWLSMVYADFVSSMLIMPYIDDVAQVTVESSGKVWSFALSGEGDELKVTSGGQEVETDTFRSLYQVLIGLPGEEYVAEVEGLDMESPLATITYTYREDSASPDTVQIYQGTSRRIYLALNGRLKASTKDKYLEIILADCDRALAGEEIQELY